MASLDWDQNKSGPPVDDIVESAFVASGLRELSPEAGAVAIHRTLQSFREKLNGVDALTLSIARSKVAGHLKKEMKIISASEIVKELFLDPSTGAGDTCGNDLFQDVDPWPEPVDGAELLGEIQATIQRFCVMSLDASSAISLWVAFAWAHETFSISPLLNLTSPTKRCGKSTGLRVVSKLVPRPLVTANISMAALFRTMEKYTPTLLIDEVDVFLKWNDEVQGLLNAGHERETAFCIRCEGESLEPKRFRVWGPKVVAGIGRRKDTLEDRAITIELRRKTKAEKTERLLATTIEPFTTLREKLARWSLDNIEILKTVDPKIPEQLNDRAVDNWYGLFAIADICGGDWPLMARRASLNLSSDNATDDENWSVLLLKDISNYFHEEETCRATTEALVKYLVEIESSPWSEWEARRKNPARQIARLLKGFGVTPQPLRTDSGKLKRGYFREHFDDVFSRYLPEGAKNA